MPTLVQQTIGTGGDFTTIGLWESGTDLDLVALDEIREGQMFAETFNEGPFISGATVDATRFRRLTFAPGAKYNVAAGTGARFGSAGSGLGVGENYFELVGVRCESGSYAAANPFATSVKFRDCYFLATAVDGSTSCIRAEGGNTEVTNCTCVQLGTRNAVEGSISLMQFVIAHCRVTLGAGQAGIRWNVSGTVQNCVSILEAGGGVGAFVAGLINVASHNASSDGTAPGTNAITGVTAAQCFDDALNDDYHVSPTSPILENGIAIVGLPNDQDGNTRPDPPSRGTLELAVAPVGQLLSLIGTGGDFATPELWESSTDLDLVALNIRAFGLLFQEPFTSNGVLINGATTDADHYRELSNYFQPPPGVYRAESLEAGPTITFALQGLQIIEPFSRASAFGVFRASGASGFPLITLEADTELNAMYAENVDDANTDPVLQLNGSTVTNSTFRSASRSPIVVSGASANPVFQFNTVHCVHPSGPLTSVVNFAAAAVSGEIVNSVVVNEVGGTDWVVGAGYTSSHNVDSDGVSAPGTDALTGTPEECFDGAPIRNYFARSSGPCDGTGVAIAGVPRDQLDRIRPDPPSRGAREPADLRGERFVSWFTAAGVPMIGPTDLPRIRIVELNTTEQVVEDAETTDIGNGQYLYVFADTKADRDYAFRVDGDPLGNNGLAATERYFFGVTQTLTKVNTEILKALFLNRATTTVLGDGSRLVQFFAADGTTLLDQILVSADGLERTP